MKGRRTPALLQLFLPAVTCGSCVDVQSTTARQGSSELVAWDYLGERPPAGASLWPADKAMPTRLKRQMKTSFDGPLLVAVVEGSDPAFIWQFNEPRRAAGLSIEFEAIKPGRFQVFWTTEKCRVFSEDCSGIVPFTPEGGLVTVPFPFHHPLRELRLDLPAEPGTRIKFRAIRFVEAAVTPVAWETNSGTSATLTAEGLLVSAANSDPWLVSPYMPFDAELADTFELQSSGPAGAEPQLFWTNALCPNFSEECSLQLLSLDQGTSAQWRALEEHPNWKGSILQLRLDPGSVPGEYRLERIALRSIR